MDRVAGAARALAAVLALALVPSAPAQTACDADVDQDGIVAASDLAELLGQWGTGAESPADIDGDGVVGGGDLAALLGLWGSVCEPDEWSTVLEAAPDPAVVTNAALRDAILASGYPWRVRDNLTQIEMVLVPAGTFDMGCSASDAGACPADEFPIRSVTLSQPFYMGRYEVTQAQWTARMGSNPSSFSSASQEVPAEQVPNRPVERVSWLGVQAFLSGTGLRLPTEAEFEFAQRAGTTTAFHSMPGFPSGTNQSAQVGNISWFNGNSLGQTRPVGGKAANALGLFDMSGNVWEFVADWYASTFPDAGPATDPLGPLVGAVRGVRAGSFAQPASVHRSSQRASTPVGLAYSEVGFRVARRVSGDAPTVASISPSEGSTSGGTVITITGTDLTGTYSLLIGGLPATNVTVINPTTVTAVTPEQAPGAKDVIVGGRSGVVRVVGGFSLISPVPSITSVSPSIGGLAGGTAITIKGTDFLGASSVTVGGVAATSFAVLDSQTVRATTPPGTAGSVAVAVTTPGGTATLPSAFAYVATTEQYLVVDQSPNPSVVTDATMRDAIIATGLPWRILDTTTQIEMLLVPAGTFSMGCSPSATSACASDENPVHTVTISQPFYLGRHEITQAQWTARMGSNPSQFQGASYPDAAARPVDRVTWNMIPGFLAGTGMRLPTEAEWEYAYRAGTTTAYHSMPGFPSGTNDGTQIGAIAWFSGNSGSQTRPVGQKAPNTLGFHDMSGNAWEWTNDWYGSTYYASSPAIDPQGPPTGSLRVLRGGSWSWVSERLRASARGVTAPNQTFADFGFRVARSPHFQPSITSVGPAIIDVVGGTVITITGTNLFGTSSVTVGGVPATGVTVVNATTVTAVAPAGTLGVKDIVLTTPGGTATLAAAVRCYALPAWATVLEFEPNPAVVTNEPLRSAIAASGLPWRVRDNATQIEMLLVPAGTYNMGCSPSDGGTCNGDELPVHAVTITRPFYLGRYEVTQAQWTARMGSNPSLFPFPSLEVPVDLVPNRPVERVSWLTALMFLSGAGLRLPTEAEWEYAYRAGTITAYHSMPDAPNGTGFVGQVGQIAWFQSNSASQTRPVGGKAANGLGFHDMSGNVWEWVNDWYALNYYLSSPAIDPQGPPTGSTRVRRGGSYGVSSAQLRSSERDFAPSSQMSGNTGFRVARNGVAAPTLTVVSPNSDATTGGRQITLSGTNLFTASAVTIGGVPATGVTVVNATTVTAVAPAGTLGAKDIVVTTSGGSATLAASFTYHEVPAWATIIEGLPDAAVVTNASLRDAITATNAAWRIRDNATQIEMVLVPAGSYSMGCSASNADACSTDESPVHTVTLTQPFYLGRYEVTQAQWTARMGSNPSLYQSASAEVPAAQVPNRPVERVSWNMVQSFLSESGLRLPTEAEREYAYRAGTTTAYHSMPGFPDGTNDENQAGNIAWFASNSNNQPRPVGGKAANALGLHDMAGNVHEWVSDWYGSAYYESSPATDPQGPSSGTVKLMRGGSWGSSTNNLRSSSRYPEPQETAGNGNGFRVARNLRPTPMLTSVDPSSGSTLGGTAITLTGTNLTGASSVTVGGNPATSVTVVNSTTVTAVTPAGAAGAASVAVTVPGGTATLANAFTYVIPAPTISAVSPTGGPVAGGTTITITGTNLTGASSVTVGGALATGVTVVNATTVTAVTPAGAAGARDVAITTPGGTATAAGAFTYVTVPSWATVLEPLPDPAVVTNATLRNAIIATNAAWRVRDNATQIEMLMVPAGTYSMGCSPSNTNACFPQESPVHSVTLTQPFYIGRYEVTQAQWTARMGSNPSFFQNASANVPAAQVPNRPVERVSMSMIQTFLSGTGLRLPTEAEWEYAYRAGTTTAYHSMPAFPNGTNDSAQVGTIAWFNGNSGSETRPVGGKAANALGIHDMGGNVWEWLSDWYSSTYYASSPATDPQGPATGSVRVLRGGGWLGPQNDARASYRGADGPAAVTNEYGFRVARALNSPTLASVAPNSGFTTGGTAITITGANLTGTSSVTVGGSAATSVTVVNATTVTAVTPAGTAGLAAVVLTTPLGTATLAGGFTYLVPPPTISVVSPTGGPVAGGTTITITGTNLTGASSVTVGGALATGVTVVNATTVTAVTPAGAAGARDVAITTPGGATTAAGAFTYVTVPSWATFLEALPDPAIVTNATLRSAIVATGAAWRVRDNATQIEMLMVPAGTFSMGCSASNANACFPQESPVHSVTLTQPFYIGRYEVTQAQWTARMGSNPSFFQNASANVPAAQVSNRPVERVSMSMIQTFLSGTGLRLPTEAEWEYAYRAGTTTAYHSMPAFPNGTNDSAQVGTIAWFNGNAGSETRPVGGKAANALGIHDMGGNVWEWLSDWYSSTYYASSPTTDPQGPATGSVRVLRGGGWLGPQNDARASYRGADGPAAVTNEYGFRVARNVFLPPSLTGSSPAVGPIAGGTTITLTGTNLTGTSSVTIGGAAATGVTVVNATTVTAVTPAGTAGARDIALTAQGGSTTLVGGFTYFDAPTITSISPSSGPITGGTTVTITGVNLTGTSSVTVGGAAATSVTVVNATTVTAVTPVGALGAATVALTTPGGTGTLSASFTYLPPPPTITLISPNSGSTLGGTTVTITGTDFVGTSAVSFGGMAASIVSTSSSSVSVLTPPRPAGTVSVSLTTPSGTATLPNIFTYVVPPPTITSISPTSGFTSGGTEVTISGTNLTGTSAVRFGDYFASGFTVVNATTVIAVTSPNMSGAAAVSLTTPGGTATLPDAFTFVQPPPTISSVSPSSGSTTGGFFGTLRGTDLQSPYSVTIGGNAAILIISSFDRIDLLVPPGSPGPATVVVTTVGGSATLPNGFTYVVPVPSIASVSPNAGPTTGGTTITITGTNLMGTTSVRINGADATNIDVVNATTVRAVTPPNPAGAYTVTVQTPGGTAWHPLGFTYVPPSPR